MLALNPMDPGRATGASAVCHPRWQIALRTGLVGRTTAIGQNRLKTGTCRLRTAAGFRRHHLIVEKLSGPSPRFLRAILIFIVRCDCATFFNPTVAYHEIQVRMVYAQAKAAHIAISPKHDNLTTIKFNQK